MSSQRYTALVSDTIVLADKSGVIERRKRIKYKRVLAFRTIQYPDQSTLSPLIMLSEHQQSASFQFQSDYPAVCHDRIYDLSLSGILEYHIIPVINIWHYRPSTWYRGRWYQLLHKHSGALDLIDNWNQCRR
jgi:hypothetical protein